MNTMKPRVTSFAPQFLVDDLEPLDRVLPEDRLHVEEATPKGGLKFFCDHPNT